MDCDRLGLQTNSPHPPPPPQQPAPHLPPTTVGEAVGASAAWLGGRQPQPSGPAQATVSRSPTADGPPTGAHHFAPTHPPPPPQMTPQPPRQDATDEPTNGQLMSILQTLLHNQREDAVCMKDGMRHIHDRLETTDQRLDHHEQVMQKLDDRIAHMQEAAAAAGPTSDPEAARAYAALHARLDALEARQRQQGAATTIPVL